MSLVDMKNRAKALTEELNEINRKIAVAKLQPPIVLKRRDSPADNFVLKMGQGYNLGSLQVTNAFKKQGDATSLNQFSTFFTSSEAAERFAHAINVDLFLHAQPGVTSLDGRTQTFRILASRNQDDSWSVSVETVTTIAGASIGPVYRTRSEAAAALAAAGVYNVMEAIKTKYRMDL